MFQKGLTLFEIIVSAVILSLAVLGLVSVFASSRIHVQYSKTKASAATLASYLLNNLSMQVHQAETSAGASDGWDENNNPLYVLPGMTKTLTGNSVPLNHIPFNSDYTISRVNDASGSDTNLRRVQLGVNWTLTY
jgi:Tfp pilus assembly protein PilV